MCNGRLVAPLELATTLDTRRRGLIGRNGVDGAMLLCPASIVHTFRMVFTIDVAFCDRHLVVLRTVRMRPNRCSRPVPSSAAVIEAEAGAFARWGVVPGARLRVDDG
jgi:uncharacterized protein